MKMYQPGTVIVPYEAPPALKPIEMWRAKDVPLWTGEATRDGTTVGWVSLEKYNITRRIDPIYTIFIQTRPIITGEFITLPTGPWWDIPFDLRTQGIYFRDCKAFNPTMKLIDGCDKEGYAERFYVVACQFDAYTAMPINYADEQRPDYEELWRGYREYQEKIQRVDGFDHIEFDIMKPKSETWIPGNRIKIR